MKESVSKTGLKQMTDFRFEVLTAVKIFRAEKVCVNNLTH
jgi:hypothetical protein